MEEYNGCATDILGCIRKVSKFERIYLSRSVSIVARIEGNVSPEKLRDTLDKVRQKHPLISAKIVFDEDYNAWFSTDNVPQLNIRIVSRVSDEQWFEELQTEIEIPFELETGPLIRFLLIYSEEVSDLVIICNHSICDGMSLAYLVRDLLLFYTNPEQEIKVLHPPNIRDYLPVNNDSSSDLNQLVEYANKQWKMHPHHFINEDYAAIQNACWERMSFDMVLLELDPDETKILSKRCKKEHVTIGSAVTAGFIAAYEDVNGPFTENQKQVSFPFDLRRHVTTPIGDVFCFCVGGSRFSYTFNASKSFWENARALHNEIHKRVEKLDTTGFLANEYPDLDPTLMDAVFYFSLFKEILPDAYNKTENLSQFSQDTENIAFSFAKKTMSKIPSTLPTNLGQLNIPTTYENLQINRIIFLPGASFSVPLVLGGVSIGGTTTFSLNYLKPKNMDDSMTKEMILIRNRVLKYLGFPDKINERKNDIKDFTK